MSTDIQPADIYFNDAGVPISNTFDDIYFSKQDGAAESTYVFLDANRLRQRFTCWPAQRPFVIAETGFGSGLNMLLAAALFLRTAPTHARLHLVSFEKFPLQAEQVQQALSHWPALRTLSATLVAQYPPCVRGCHRIELAPRITLDLHFGDVLEALPAWQAANPGCVHAWFLDGFAPSKNPQMWQPALYEAMYKAASHNCTLATFTAVGTVRRGLQSAGFAMYKHKGFAHKRDMLVGRKQQPEPLVARPLPQRVAIVGGGIAAACTAVHLARKGKQVTVFCRHTHLAAGASGNAQGAVYPLLQVDYTPATALYSQAFLYASKFYQTFSAPHMHACGVLQLAFNSQQHKRQQKLVQRQCLSAQLVYPVSASQASTLAGIPLNQPGLYFPQGGWVDPALTVQELVHKSAAEVKLSTEVTQVDTVGDQVLLHTLNAGESGVEKFDAIVWAGGAELASQLPELTIRPVAGQVSYVHSNQQLQTLQTVVCHKGYLTPAADNKHCVGATFHKGVSEPQSNPADDAANLNLLSEHLPTLDAPMLIAGNRVSVRATTADHMPLVGRIAPHTWVLAGLGSRGFTSAPWAAQLLTDMLCHEVSACSGPLQHALDPMRFAKRCQRADEA